MPSRLLPTLATLGTLLAASVSHLAPLHAQAPLAKTELALLGGPMSYDLAGTGDSWGVGARASIRLARVFAVEPGLSYFSYQPDPGVRITYLFPEVSGLLLVPTPLVQPYLATGLGLGLAAQGPADSDLSVHLGLGVRTALAGRLGARAEMRWRNISLGANQSLYEYFIGVTYRP